MRILRYGVKMLIDFCIMALLVWGVIGGVLLIDGILENFVR